MSSLSGLQRIFPTLELNWGLLHCRRILYQLSYQVRFPPNERICSMELMAPGKHLEHEVGPKLTHPS